jgi:hypothetical protein
LLLALREIRRVLSAKMASNQLKTSQKLDLDSFQGIAHCSKVKSYKQ